MELERAPCIVWQRPGVTTMDVGTLAKSRYLSLTTFRRDGTPVATPVWVAQQGDELLVHTAKSSGKAKRLRNSSRVLLAPCDTRGRVTGDVVEGIARLQDEAETAVAFSLIRQRYGLQARLLFWWNGRRARGRPDGADVGIAIRLGGSVAGLRQRTPGGQGPSRGPSSSG